MESTSNHPSGVQGKPQATDLASGQGPDPGHAPAGGLVRTRSGRLVRADQNPATFSASEKPRARPWAAFAVLGVLFIGLLGLAMLLVSSSSGGKKGSIDSILKDVGFVIRQQKGPGITR